MKGLQAGFGACATLLALVGCGSSHTGGGEDAAIVVDLDGATFDAGVPDGGPADAGPPVASGVGTACADSVDCTGDTDTCLSDPELLPGGYCTRSCAGGGDCPEGSTCLEIGMGQAFCFDDCDPSSGMRECRAGYGCAQAPMIPPVCLGGCTDDSDCPEGLRCDPAGGVVGAGGCYDPDSTIGAPCTRDDQCPMGGFCLSEDLGGYPGGTCIGFGCDVERDEGCDGDAHCVPGGGGGGGVCLDGCASDADCRPGYACRAPAAYPDRRLCTPACRNDDACTGTNVCNPALGTCDEPFDPRLLGQPCSRFRGGCEGGTCLSEGETGFPGAYCAYVGCTVGDDSSCPAGGACAPGAGGANVCLDACASDGDCRAGYACRNVDPSNPASSRACLPACTDDAQCANHDRFGFECNVGTGLCGPPFVASTQGEPCTGRDDCVGGRCLTEAEGWPAGTCVAVGCALASGVDGEPCPAGSTCVDDGVGRAEIGYCLETCTVGAPTGCRTGYACVSTEGETGVCRPAGG